MARLILHEYAASGNCYKIRLTAALLGVPLELRRYDILNGETRTPAFLATINHDGRILMLQIDDWMLPESGAACWWLAEGTRLIPEDRFARAQVLRWMFFEQNAHEPNIATLRLWAHIGDAALTPERRAAIPIKRAAGEAALATLDQQLTGRRFLVEDTLSLADIILYPYTHVAEEGGFRLDRYPAVQAWLRAVEAVPGYVRMQG